MGFFVNTLVLRADVSGDPGFGVLLGRVREAVLAGQARQDVPFERLVEVLNPARSPARHPLFQVMIADQDVGAGRLAAARADVRPSRSLTVAAKFDLTLGFQQDHGAGGAPAGIGASFEYAADLFDEATVRALAGRLTRLLRQAAARPGPAAERASTCSPPPNGGCLRDGTTPRGRCPAATLAGAVRGAGGADPGCPGGDLRGPR